jgi:hypothetical protein
MLRSTFQRLASPLRVHLPQQQQQLPKLSLAATRAHSSAAPTSYQWDDPLRLDSLLKEEEREIRDQVNSYCQSKACACVCVRVCSCVNVQCMFALFVLPFVFSLPAHNTHTHTHTHTHTDIVPDT